MEKVMSDFLGEIYMNEAAKRLENNPNFYMWIDLNSIMETTQFSTLTR